MKLRQCVLMMALVLLVPAAAHANDFGVLHTAIPVEKSVWRLQGGGVISLEDEGREALVLGAATGLAPKFDFEAKLSISGDDMAIGGGVGYLITQQNVPVDLNVGAGFHYVNHDTADITAFDVNVIGSKAINPKFSLYGAFSISFGSQDIADSSDDDSFTRAHLIPGMEYKLNDKVNVVVELGIALNDSATNYLGGSIQYYIR
jgi:hypothetical protein